MTTPTEATGAHRRALLLLGIFCALSADVQDGLGPFLGVHLQASGWAPDQIGFIMTASAAAGLAASPLAGAAADRMRAKRALCGLSLAAIILSSLLLLIETSTSAILVSQLVSMVAAATVAPVLSALTLGLAGEALFARQLGRNEAWRHFGTCAAAAACAGLASLWGLSTPFIVMSVLGAAALAVLAAIPAEAIDHDAARGLDAAAGDHTESVSSLLREPVLLVLGTTLFFFHLGNAAILPLLGQSAVARFGLDPTEITATTIFIAQTTMIPTALLGARIAERSGCGVLLLAALAVLPIRGLIAGYWVDPTAVVPVQILDGIGAGLTGVATPGLAAALLRHSGRINLGLGIVLLMQGVGAALSTSLGGAVAARFGYEAGFIALAAAPLAGLALWIFALSRPAFHNARRPFGSGA